jgi:CelD/BcsL family acetyltransferase involved in cellulose biosynthesis
MLASITRQRRLAVSEAILQQRLTVIYSKRSGRVDQFVVVDDRLKGWLEERAAWCATEQVGLCRWHEPEDLAAAIENGRIYSRQAPDNIVTEDGSPPDALQVRLGFRFVEWAVGGMPNREHALLLKNRVVDA